MTEMYAHLTGCDYIRNDLERTLFPDEPGDSDSTYLRMAIAIQDHSAEQDPTLVREASDLPRAPKSAVSILYVDSLEMLADRFAKGSGAIATDAADSDSSCEIGVQTD